MKKWGPGEWFVILILGLGAHASYATVIFWVVPRPDNIPSVVTILVAPWVLFVIVWQRAFVRSIEGLSG